MKDLAGAGDEVPIGGNWGFTRTAFNLDWTTSKAWMIFGGNGFSIAFAILFSKLGRVAINFALLVLSVNAVRI